MISFSVLASCIFQFLLAYWNTFVWCVTYDYFVNIQNQRSTVALSHWLGKLNFADDLEPHAKVTWFFWMLSESILWKIFSWVASAHFLLADTSVYLPHQIVFFLSLQDFYCPMHVILFLCPLSGYTFNRLSKKFYFKVEAHSMSANIWLPDSSPYSIFLISSISMMYIFPKVHASRFYIFDLMMTCLIFFCSGSWPDLWLSNK